MHLPKTVERSYTKKVLRQFYGQGYRLEKTTLQGRAHENRTSRSIIQPSKFLQPPDAVCLAATRLTLEEHKVNLKVRISGEQSMAVIEDRSDYGRNQDDGDRNGDYSRRFLATPEVEAERDKSVNKLDDLFQDIALRAVLRDEALNRNIHLDPNAILPMRKEQRQSSDNLASLDLTKEIYANIAPSTVEIYSGSGISMAQGSGSFVNDNGDVLTCAHVVSGRAPNIMIRTYDRKEYPAEVVKIDADHDLALLRTKIPKNEIKPIELADRLPVAGEPVFSLGSPMRSSEGNPQGLHFAISPGIYAHLGTIKELMHGYQPISRFNFLSQNELDDFNRQMELPAEVVRVNFDHGSSGGSLVNAEGKLVGVNSSLSLKEGVASYQEVSCRPVDDLRNFLVSSDPKLNPKSVWTGAFWTDPYLASLKIQPLETAGTTALYATPAALLVSNLLPRAAAGIPVVSTMAKASTFLATSAVAGSASMAAINDGYNLYHSNNARDYSRYGLALLADGGIIAGAILKNKVGAIPLLASLAGRVATEFIPNQHVLE